LKKINHGVILVLQFKPKLRDYIAEHGIQTKQGSKLSVQSTLFGRTWKRVRVAKATAGGELFIFRF
jgi:hypothetical protein